MRAIKSSAFATGTNIRVTDLQKIAAMLYLDPLTGEIFNSTNWRRRHSLDRFANSAAAAFFGERSSSMGLGAGTYSIRSYTK